MESARKAHQRLKTYPILVARCSQSATAYAACITRDLDVQKHACDKEFKIFKKCVAEVAKSMKTKL